MVQVRAVAVVVLQRLVMMRVGVRADDRVVPVVVMPVVVRVVVVECLVAMAVVMLLGHVQVGGGAEEDALSERLNSFAAVLEALSA